ncbi:hypothetical protein [Streptomyces sp. MnatMP-M27]|uniref:hypothetical protein n=1 Tax=Streptomyces sp. MnatMP-M27 TaxID=1839768 RepID=UPI00159F3286|nr:hypothetical protein [Streptomyces sp. MnatMP-M27]
MKPGRVLHLSLFLGGHLSTRCPVRVVDAGADGLLLWLAVGSPVWRAALPTGVHLRDVPPEQRPATGYPLETGHRHRGNPLIHQPSEVCHGVWWLFSSADGDGGFSGWYVNLEQAEDIREEGRRVAPLAKTARSTEPGATSPHRPPGHFRHCRPGPPATSLCARPPRGGGAEHESPLPLDGSGGEVRGA